MALIDLNHDASEFVVAAESGGLFTLKFEDEDVLLVDCVGEIEHGIQDFVRAPDEELFILVTKDKSIIIMTRYVIYR